MPKSVQIPIVINPIEKISDKATFNPYWKFFFEETMWQVYMNITSVKKCLNIRKNGYHRWFFINSPAFIGSNDEFYSASLNTERFRVVLSKKWE